MEHSSPWVDELREKCSAVKRRGAEWPRTADDRHLPPPPVLSLSAVDRLNKDLNPVRVLTETHLIHIVHV